MAQKQINDLGIDHDIQAGRDKALLVKDRYSNNVTSATAVFKKYRERLGYLMPAAQADDALMNDSTITAAYMDAYCSWADPLNNPGGNQRIGSSANIVIPYGEFWVTRSLPKGMGSVIGSGSFSGGSAPGSTVLCPWHESWRDPIGKRTIMVSQIRGVVGNMGYLESMDLDMIRFDGRANYNGSKYYDASYECHGFLDAGAGENNNVGVKMVRADNCNDYGVAWAGATPGRFGNITAFKNRLAGVGVLGGALATMTIDLLSCDDNSYMFRCVRGTVPGDGGDEGAMLRIGTMKDEAGTNTEADLGAKYQGQMVGEVIGQGGVIIDMIQMASSYYRCHSMFKVDPYLKNYGSPQSLVIKVGLLKQNRSMPDGKPAYENYFVDVRNHLMWKAAMQGQAIYDLVYDSNDDDAYHPAVYVKQGRKVAAVPYPQNERLGFLLAGSGVFDAVAGTPPWSFTDPSGSGTTPPSPLCTWVPGTPVLGVCVGGTQTKTTPWVASPQGCTPGSPQPSPTVEQVSCAMPPTLVASWPVPPATSWVNTNKHFKQAVSWNGITMMRIYGIKPSEMDSKWICCRTDGRGIVIAPDGSIWCVDTMVAPAGTLSTTVAKDFVEIRFPAISFVQFGDSKVTTDGSYNNNAFIGTFTRIELYK